MITVSITGCIDSETKACSGWLCSGRRSPGMRASSDECPGATQPTRSALTGPRLVCSARIRPPSMSMPVTSQPSIRSTPSRLAARPQPRAPASRCATPPPPLPRPPGARLPTGPRHRVAAAAAAIELRDFLLPLAGAEPLGIDALQRVGVDPALDVAHVLQRMAQVEHAALAEHHIHVQFLAQALPQLERVLVELRRLVPQIVRAHDRGVARRVAAAQIALFQ